MARTLAGQRSPRETHSVSFPFSICTSNFSRGGSSSYSGDVGLILLQKFVMPTDPTGCSTTIISPSRSPDRRPSARPRSGVHRRTRARLCERVVAG